MKTITIVFDGDKVMTEAKGFEGKNCIKETEAILASLKPELKDRKLKQEYNKVGEQARASL